MNKTEYNATAVLIIFQVIVAITCFLILMAVFEFPDILRESSEYRLSLFLENKDIVIPTYYFLSLTGLGQIIISVMFYQIFGKASTLNLLCVVFGVLCGLFQAIGFIRWAVLIPYIAEMKDVSPEIVGFIEGAFNRYAGMAIGEHLGFLMQAFWTLFLSLAILKTSIFDRLLGQVGLIIGGLTIAMSLEPLGEFFSFLGELTNPVETAWYIWLIFLAASLLCSKKGQKQAPVFGIKSLVFSMAVWSAFVVPAYL